MTESKNDKKKWRLRFLKKERRKMPSTINENDK